MQIRRFLAVAAAIAAFSFVGGCGSPETSTNDDSSASGSSGVTLGAADGQATSGYGSDPLHPEIVLETSLGNITLRLDAEKAPLTVANFLQYMHQGYYNETIFHHVENGFILLGGGYTSALKQKPARTPVRNEAHNGLKNRHGTVAMARNPEAIDSSTCQFFINLVDNPTLDYTDRTAEEYGYCVFGEVVQGWDVCEKIATVETHHSDDFEKLPIRTVLIEKVRHTR